MSSSLTRSIFRLASSPPAARAREGALLFFPGPARRRLERARSARERLTAVQRLLPGGAHQVPEEIAGLLGLVAELAPVNVCEIGTADGGTTLLLAHAAPTIRRMIGIDVRIRHRRQLEVLVPRQVALHLLEQSSLDPQTCDQLDEILGGEPLDLLFIDGSHAYESVRRDYFTYRPRVRKGGLIVFHDIVLDHRQRFGADTPMYSGGVPRFWREVRDGQRWREFVHDPEQDAFGIGVIEHDPIRAPRQP